MIKRNLASLCLVTLFLAACSKQPGPSTATESIVTADKETVIAQEVLWFSGSLDEAFALAAAENKPVFVYWGAEWCPYCKQLQATIFVREEFIRLSRQFIAVDMSNGDSETILQGDRFDIYGLPTVILFAPDGTELTRVPGGMDMEQYAAALELTLDNLRPVTGLLAAAKAGETLADDDWRLLGNYSWQSDRARMLEEEDPAAMLAQLARDCPARLALTCSQLRLSAIGFWLTADKEKRDPTIASEHLQAFASILADPSLRTPNLAGIAEMGKDVITQLASGEQQDELQNTLLGHLQAAASNESLNVLQRATLLSGWAEVAAALLDEGETPPASQVAWGREAADGMMAELSHYQVHAGINLLWGVYYDLGLETEARAALARGIEESKTPFYFMSAMAYVEQKAGNEAEALAWSRKAWDTAEEPMHRARWGRGYIRRLFEMAPEQSQEIQRAVSLWLAELAAQPHGFEAYASPLERLDTQLQEWVDQDPARGEIAAKLRTEMTAYCDTVSSEGQVAVCET